MADNEPTHSYHKQLEDICCILKECTLIDSLKICDAIIAQISEYSIGSIVRCEYWEYCKNMVVVVDHEVDEYDVNIGSIVKIWLLWWITRWMNTKNELMLSIVGIQVIGCFNTYVVTVQQDVWCAIAIY
eukprot:1053263_1